MFVDTEAQRAWKRAEREALEDALYQQIVRACLPEPQRQCKPIPGRQFRVDFCWEDARLVAEVEGGVFQRRATGHRSTEGVVRDMDKYNRLALLGWRVLRFHVGQIGDRTAVETIREALA